MKQHILHCFKVDFFCKLSVISRESALLAVFQKHA